MTPELAKRVDNLLREADHAANSGTSGLFDRVDLQDIIQRLMGTVHQLTEICEHLEHERNVMNERLRRSSYRLLDPSDLITFPPTLQQIGSVGAL